jgi:peptide/nickel transport system substrate-binding protein
MKGKSPIFFWMIMLFVVISFVLPSANAGPQKNEELVIVTSSFAAEGALPHLGSAVDMNLWQGLYERLVGRDKQTGDPVPTGLAERWEPSGDYKMWTFYLRKGIPWHDGWGEFTAEDLKFSIELVVRKDSANSQASEWRKGITKIKIHNPYKVSFELAKPSWQFVHDLTDYPPHVPMVCKKYIESVGMQKANQHPIGTGPYKLHSRRSGDFIKFVAVDKHWRKVPEFKWLTVMSVPELSTRISMLRAGKADIIPLPIDSVPQMKKLNIRTVFNPGGRIYWVVLGSQANPQHPHFKKRPWWADPADKEEWEKARKVRKALNLAINRKEIVDALYHGKAVPFGLGNFGWPGQPGYDAKLFPPLPYNPAEAKRLLAEAGYPHGFEVSMILLKQAGRPDAVILGEAVAIFWEKIGLKVKRIPMDFATLRPKMYDRKVDGCWVYGARMYAEPIVSAYRTSNRDRDYLTGAEYGPLEALAKKGYRETDPEKRHKISMAWAKMAYDLFFTVPLVGLGTNWAVSDKVGEWPLVPGYGFPLSEVEYITAKRSVASQK